MSETVSSVFKVASDDDYYVTKSFSWEASWRDVLYDFGVFLGSLLAGMVVYMIIVITIDMDRIDEKKEEYCYTDEEAREKYGPKEGREFGEDVMICGHKLPKKRAMKFMKYSGRKAAEAFAKLSFEEKYSVMVGSLKFPDEFLRDSMSDYWRGSKGKKCDACGEKPAGEQKFEVCGRCEYTACNPCRLDKKLGTCFCQEENFGLPYPAVSRRKFYQKGIW